MCHFSQLLLLSLPCFASAIYKQHNTKQGRYVYAKKQKTSRWHKVNGRKILCGILKPACSLFCGSVLCCALVCARTEGATRLERERERDATTHNLPIKGTYPWRILHLRIFEFFFQLLHTHTRARARV